MKELRVNIGIDFGTSNTKIAYQIVGDIVRPLIHNHPFNSNYYPNYCLPSLVTVDEDGFLVLGSEAAAISLNQPNKPSLFSLKMLLAGKYAEDFKDPTLEQLYSDVIDRSSLDSTKLTPEVLTVLYLLYAMRVSSYRILNEYAQNDVLLKPYFHVCMPIHHLESQPVKSVFENILAVTQIIYDHYGGIKNLHHPLRPYENLVDWILGALNNTKINYNESADHTRVFFKSETLAQISSYRTSSMRVDGLHVLIDIGAGTTDVTILNLRNVRMPGEILEIFGWRNFPKGGRQIEQDILERLNEESRELVLQYIVDSKSDVTAIIRKRVNELRESTKPAWRDAYKFGLDARGINLDDWKGKGVTILLCGGGGKFPYTEEIFGKSFLKWQEGIDFPDNPVIYLPCPSEKYDEKSNVPFHRMSVAYGLANHELFKCDIDPDTWELPERKKPKEYGDFDGDKLIPNADWLGEG